MMKSVAVQSHIDKLPKVKDKSRNHKGIRSKNSCKTLNYAASDLYSKTEKERESQNSDLVEPNIPSNCIIQADRNSIWTSGQNRISPITNVVFQENNFVSDKSSPGSILPQLKKTESGAKTARNDLFKLAKSPRGKSSDHKPSSKDLDGITRKGISSGDDKHNRLQSIYGHNKTGMVKKVHKDPITGEKVIKGKVAIKNLIRNATARN